MEVLTALTARDAIEAIPTADADVLLLDVRLGEHNGLDVLRALEPDRRPRWAVVMTGFDLEGIEEEARRLGAVFVHKAEIQDPAALVREVLTGNLPGSASPAPGPMVTPPAVTVWAEAMVQAVAAPSDPRTLGAWGRTVGRSRGAMKELCALAGASARHSCQLARVLRAVHLAEATARVRPAQWLEVGDRRTAQRLLERAGVPRENIPTLAQVLRTQQFLRDEALLAALANALRRAGFLRRA